MLPRIRIDNQSDNGKYSRTGSTVAGPTGGEKSRSATIPVRTETIHIGNVSMRGTKIYNRKFDNNLVERLQGTVRDRNKTQRGLKSEESVFVKGHQLYYNFIKPHDGLNDYTPAHFANIYLELGDEKWKNLLTQAIKYQILRKKAN